MREVVEKNLLTRGLSDDGNFHSYGLDSLQTAEVVTKLKASLASHREASKLSWISADTIYKHPSITELLAVVLDFLNNGRTPGRESAVDKMSEMYESFVELLPRLGNPPSKTSYIKNLSVAVTGTTGSVGGQLVVKLLDEPSVGKVYCLN